MKRRLIALLEHIRADLGLVIHAVERDDATDAQEQLEAIAHKITEAAKDLA